LCHQKEPHYVVDENLSNEEIPNKKDVLIVEADGTCSYH
jgi:hypothetical protein